MLTMKPLNLFTQCALTVAVLAGTTQIASAHTRLETATVNENTRITNNVISEELRSCHINYFKEQ